MRRFDLWRAAALLYAAALLGGATAEPATAPGSSFHRLHQGRLQHADLPRAATAVLLYHGASWCGPCRAFVPELAAAYPQLRARGIEIVFVGHDGSCAAEQDYARASRMPWLLLPCRHRARRERLRTAGGAALPGIMLVDRNGALLLSSWRADGSSRPRAMLGRIMARQPLTSAASTP